jgi:hypothetical protein
MVESRRVYWALMQVAAEAIKARRAGSIGGNRGGAAQRAAGFD